MSGSLGAGGAPTNPSVNPTTGLPTDYPLKPDWEITPRELAAQLSRGLSAGTILLDCRRDEEFAFNRLPGAVQIEMNQTERRADELESEQGTRDHPVIVYCHHGRRSLQVTATLRALGFSNVKSLAGGIDAWSLGIDSAVPRY